MAGWFGSLILGGIALLLSRTVLRLYWRQNEMNKDDATGFTFLFLIGAIWWGASYLFIVFSVRKLLHLGQEYWLTIPLCYIAGFLTLLWFNRPRKGV